MSKTTLSTKLTALSTKVNSMLLSNSKFSFTNQTEFKDLNDERLWNSKQILNFTAEDFTTTNNAPVLTLSNGAYPIQVVTNVPKVDWATASQTIFVSGVRYERIGRYHSGSVSWYGQWKKVSYTSI